MNEPASKAWVLSASPSEGERRPDPSPPKAGQSRRRVAVIDLGTNNCRLLIAEQVNRPYQRRAPGFRIVDSFSRIVRLGEGLSQTGTLGTQAMDRTLAALKVCAHKIIQSGAQEVQAVATEACRRAANGESFLAEVKAQTGIHLRTISPIQEVQLGVSSALPLFNKRFAHGLIFDVGGGSTEVSFLKFRPGKGFTLQASLSVPLGVVNLAESYSARGPDLTLAAYGAMAEKVYEAFADFSAQQGIGPLQRQRQVQTVGMSGTVTTVKALELGLKSYRRAAVDRTLFEMQNLQPIRDQLITIGHQGLQNHGCIGRDRADLVLPGIAILEGLARAFDFSRLLVLDRGLREGLLHDIFHRKPKRRRDKRQQSTL